jgi:glycosyltransferase involved in cell wall biosynthesis
VHILITSNLVIPALKYGGTERVVWWLGKELFRRGHTVTYLAPAGSSCPFGDVIVYDPAVPLGTQIPDSVDVVHANFPVLQEMPKPYLVTMHGYDPHGGVYDRNTVFISRRHAELHHATCYLYHGLDPQEYGTFNPNAARRDLLFLAHIGRKEKNLKGAIRIASKARKHLSVVGGRKFTLNPRIHYYGMLGGDDKNIVLTSSTALLNPITWDEPFGLSIIEALYHGCPVIGTPYGSLPELVTSDVGFLSSSEAELIAACKDHSAFSRKRCHDYVMTYFVSNVMTDGYLSLYQRVISGEWLNDANPYFTHDTFIENYPITK